jgi:hypothetical protein
MVLECAKSIEIFDLCAEQSSTPFIQPFCYGEISLGRLDFRDWKLLAITHGS